MQANGVYRLFNMSLLIRAINTGKSLKNKYLEKKRGRGARPDGAGSFARLGVGGLSTHPTDDFRKNH